MVPAKETRLYSARVVAERWFLTLPARVLHVHTRVG